MSATTIKLDSKLVDKVDAIKPSQQSISAYVRSLIEREHSEQLLREAAANYEAFLRNNPVEHEAMETWEKAPLTDAIEPNQP